MRDNDASIWMGRLDGRPSVLYCSHRRRGMTSVRRIFVLAALAILLGAPLAHAQTTGSITGVVTDASGALLPGVTITLSGERLIGGTPHQDRNTTRLNPSP